MKTAENSGDDDSGCDTDSGGDETTQRRDQTRGGRK
jgi:hypothetical protein